jgi:hypothetical protein
MLEESLKLQAWIVFTQLQACNAHMIYFFSSFVLFSFIIARETKKKKIMYEASEQSIFSLAGEKGLHIRLRNLFEIWKELNQLLAVRHSGIGILWETKWSIF